MNKKEYNEIVRGQGGYPKFNVGMLGEDDSAIDDEFMRHSGMHKFHIEILKSNVDDCHPSEEELEALAKKFDGLANKNEIICPHQIVVEDL